MKPGLTLATMAMLLVPSANGAPETHAAEAVQGAAKARLPQGEQIFQQYCQACHQVNGQGLTGAFPHRVGIHQSCHGLRDLRNASSSELVGPKFNKPRQLLASLAGEGDPPPLHGVLVP